MNGVIAWKHAKCLPNANSEQKLSIFNLYVTWVGNWAWHVCVCVWASGCMHMCVHDCVHVCKCLCGQCTNQIIPDCFTADELSRVIC